MYLNLTCSLKFVHYLITVRPRRARCPCALTSGNACDAAMDNRDTKRSDPKYKKVASKYLISDCSQFSVLGSLNGKVLKAKHLIFLSGLSKILFTQMNQTLRHKT